MQQRADLERWTRSRRPPAVVLCEAYDSLREVLALVLGDHYRVTAVSRVVELWPVLAAEAPALLILDVDGQPQPYEALRRLRHASRDLRVLLLAGAFTLDEQLAAVQLANVSFLPKLFSLERFREKVDTLIRGSSRSPIRTRIIRFHLYPIDPGAPHTASLQAHLSHPIPSGARTPQAPL